MARGDVARKNRAALNELIASLDLGDYEAQEAADDIAKLRAYFKTNPIGEYAGEDGTLDGPEFIARTLLSRSYTDEVRVLLDKYKPGGVNERMDELSEELAREIERKKNAEIGDEEDDLSIEEGEKSGSASDKSEDTGSKRGGDEETANEDETETVEEMAEKKRKADEAFQEKLDDAEVPVGKKAKFTWFLSSVQSTSDEYNVRNKDGTLKKKQILAPVPADKVRDPNKEIPDSILKGKLKTAIETLYKVNGKAFYDAVDNALGVLPEDLYLLLPNNYTPVVCEPRFVGKGAHHLDVDIQVAADVYALAKKQFMDKSYPNAMEWAMLRMEGFKAGWFDNQKYVKRVAPLVDALDTFGNDLADKEAELKVAWHLAGFVPFVVEFMFRTYGNGYTSSNKTDFVARAEKFAISAGLGEITKFTTADVLYGQAFHWIGVRRVMMVLKECIDDPQIPGAFKIRAKSAPAGQALITTTEAAIFAMKTSNWWDEVKLKGGFIDDEVTLAAKAIYANPWKYHMMSSVYGYSPLSKKEVEMIESAKRKANMFAPILQAFIESLGKDSDLSNARALIKPANANTVLYSKAKGFFTHIQAVNVKNIVELFATDMLTVGIPGRGKKNIKGGGQTDTLLIKKAGEGDKA